MSMHGICRLARLISICLLTLSGDSVLSFHGLALDAMTSCMVFFD